MKRRVEVWELMVHLTEAQEQLDSPKGTSQDLAFGGLRAAWRIEAKNLPPVLLADLIAEAWAVLAEEGLNCGSLPRSELALSMAEAAALAGSGDPQVMAHLHLGWALHHRAKGEADQARACLTLLLNVAESIQDPQLIAEAELWTYLFSRERGRDYEAQAAFRQAGTRLPAGERQNLVARLQARLKPTSPASQAEPAPDPTLEDTWEEPSPKGKP